jgi:hypothetical protein
MAKLVLKQFVEIGRFPRAGILKAKYRDMLRGIRDA